MKVILTQDVPGLGKAGEIKDVADGYARNSLLAKGYAAPAPKGSIKLRQESRRANVSPDLKPAEADLLQKINQGLPQDLQQHYRELIEKRDAELLTPDEYTELLDLTDQVEQLEARRVEYLVELARRRNTTVTELIQELGIRPSVYV